MKCHTKIADIVRTLWPILLAAFFVAGTALGASPGRTEAKPLRFSAQPDANEISSARIFDEPLLPLGGKPTAAENRALAQALADYAGRSDLDDFSSVENFLAQFPQSAWSGSLLLHMGTEYYNYGYYSRALDAWERAWKLSKHVTDPMGKPQADRALGELARMYCKLGREVELQKLFEETSNQPLTGPATQMIHAAGQGLWLMQNQPKTSYRCGPLALDLILNHENPSKSLNTAILASQSTTNGYSLAQLPRLSWDAGMNYKPIFRNPDAPVPVPSVIHWKVGHYAAVVERDRDRYLVQDNTFRNNSWITLAAINSEGSGYFLVPPGPLDRGWRSVPEQEAQGVWGKGPPSAQVPGALTIYDVICGCPSNSLHGMTTYTMHTMLVSLTLSDTPVGYIPPVGQAVNFTATYNQLEGSQPATFSYSNLGQKWTCNWIAYITDNPNSSPSSVTYYVDGGGTLDFTYNTTAGAYEVEPMSQALLVMTSSSSYEMQFPDGSKKEFTMPDGSTTSSRRIFLTQVIDPAGNVVQLNYDNYLRITNVVDAIGQSTVFSYTNAAFTNAITAVTDPFGRSANFLYDTNGKLIQITDVLGLKSQYTYGTSDFVNALTTPYGTTTFACGGGFSSGVTWLQATDPLGESEYLEYIDNAPISYSDPAAVVPVGMAINANSWLNYRNSFYWDKKAYADGAGDITKATIYHFLHLGTSDTESPILESVKKPLENRVWYTYLGQLYSLNSGNSSQPSFVGRVLDDGTTQLYGYQYNPLGNVTNASDPVGRNFTYVYSTNNVDLLAIYMTRDNAHELQASFTYNSQHLALTVTDASGQTTTNKYNAQGQILSISDPLGELTTFSYATNGYLLCVTGALQNASDVIGFTYDGFGRVKTTTDTQGYTLTNDYDAMDRKVRVTYPDGTFDQFVYSNLDLTATCDRLGRWTANIYNADRQLVRTIDPLERTNTYEYCKCGAMTALTDPMGRTTTWSYDVESRPVAKQYADGATVTYVYETTTSRLAAKCDEKKQETIYEYYPDGNLKRASFPNAIVATPPVSFTFDQNYNRVMTMQDGVGTTKYGYNQITPNPVLGAGKLANVSGPLTTSTITYQYDALGRILNDTVNGSADNRGFDQLGRCVAETNALGTFQYFYVGATGRVKMELCPNGQTNVFTYYGITGDERVQQISHFKPDGSLLSSFGYCYNPVGQITAWTNDYDSLPRRIWSLGYDAADRLTDVSGSGGPSVVTNWVYAYDLADNRILVITNFDATTYTHNALNQLIGNSFRSSSSSCFEWDAENRLVAINNVSNRSEFFYDGLGREVENIELSNDVPVVTNQFVWRGNSICEADCTGSIRRQLFNQGETGDNGNRYYYARDHQGSIREVTDTNAALMGRFDYDPFGSPSVVFGDFNPEVLYAGYLVHYPSGLYLTRFRALNSSTGRWLSRDPLGEIAGINLYIYAGANPVNCTDPMGLQVNINLFSPTESPYLFHAAQNTPQNGHYLVGGHGGFAMFLGWVLLDQNGNYISPQRLVERIKADTKHYSPGMEVDLLSCKLGSGSAWYPQQVAKLLGSQVNAADNFVAYNPNGTTRVVGDMYDSNGKDVPDFSRTGNILPFTPK